MKPAVMADADVERALIASILVYPECSHELINSLVPLDFADLRYRAIWEHIRSVAVDGQLETLDLITLRRGMHASGEWARVGMDNEALIDLNDAASFHPSALGDHYAKILRECSLRRSIAKLSRRMDSAVHTAQSDPHEVLSSAVDALVRMAEMRSEGKPEHIREIVKSEFLQLEKRFAERQKTGTVKVGSMTGIASLDRLLCGLEPKELIIIAGRPSMGKTALALQVAKACDLDGVVLFWSAEMSREQVTARYISAAARIDSGRLRTADLHAGDWAPLSRACNEVSNYPIVIEDAPAPTIMQIRSLAAKIHAEQGLAMLIVDYLQLISAAGLMGETTHEQIGSMCRGLKTIAKQYNCPVIALSQLNRALESRTNKRPMLSDLRASGAIEETADKVALLYREHYYDREADEKAAEIIVGKARNGATGVAHTRFYGQYTVFSDT